MKSVIISIVFFAVLLSSCMTTGVRLANQRAKNASDTTTNIEEIDIPAIVRFVRIYGGGNERLPPVLILQRANNIQLPFGEKSITVELDIASSVPPNFVATFIHCKADWSEDNNVFLNDIIFMRTSNIRWELSPVTSRYYSYRGYLSFPNESIKIPYGGNWKVQFKEIGNDTTLYAEARFFVVDPLVQGTMELIADFYQPIRKVSPSALVLEAQIGGNPSIPDAQVHSAVFYRINRWNEPIVCTQSSSLLFPLSRSSIEPRTYISGMASVQKRFRVEHLPAENDYRILDMSNVAQFPRVTQPVRIPFADLRRNGSILFRADDGAMITRGISQIDDDYVPVEFVLDPENRPVSDDVFVTGSFNNWNPTRDWQMTYDIENRQYKLRQWIRRARHNYSYATGVISANSQDVVSLSYEEFEGNNVGAGTTFIAFIYMRDPAFGGYDTIISVCAGSVFGMPRR